MLKYTGKRYVPKMCGEWLSSNEYEPLSIVTYQGASYTSKKDVPKSIELTNNEYWVLTGDYNAQVQNYKTELANKMDNIIKKINDTVIEQDEKINNVVSTSITEVNNNVDSKISEFKTDVNKEIEDFTENIENNNIIFKNTIETNVKKISEDLTLNVSLASQITPKFRNFIDYSPTDTNLELQGSCVIDSSNILLAFANNETTSEQGTIIIYNIATNTVVSEYKNVSLWHGNDFHYDYNKNELWVASMYSENGKSVTILDYSTMTLKKSIELNFLDGWCMGIILKDEYYIVNTLNAIYICSYDNSLIKSFKVNNVEKTCQGISLYKDKYILYTALYTIYVFDLDGKLIKTYTLPKNPEYESLLVLPNNDCLLTHRNYGMNNKIISLKTLNISEERDPHKITYFDNLYDLGITPSSEQETIENICASIGDNSCLIWGKIATNTASCYPAPTGLLEVRRYDRTKTTLKFTEAGNTLCNTWIGNYNKNLTPSFGGWKKVTTSETQYRVLDFYDLGLTPDDFTLSFEENIQKIIPLLGKGKLLKTYTWSTQSNTNLYNSIKEWTGNNSDAFDITIENSFNGTINLPTKIRIIPNSSTVLKPIEFYGYFDNVLSNAQEFISKAEVTSLIAKMKTEVLSEVATKYQLKTS